MVKAYGVRVTIEPVNVTGPDAARVIAEAAALIAGVFTDQGLVVTTTGQTIVATTTGMLAGT